MNNPVFSSSVGLNHLGCKTAVTGMGNEPSFPCQPHVASDSRIQVAAIKLQIVPLPTSSCLVIWTQVHQGNNPLCYSLINFATSLSHFIKEINPTQTLGFCSGRAQCWGEMGKKGLKNPNPALLVREGWTQVHKARPGGWYCGEISCSPHT